MSVLLFNDTSVVQDDICYTIEESKRRGSSSVQLHVKAIKIHDDDPAQQPADS